MELIKKGSQQQIGKIADASSLQEIKKTVLKSTAHILRKRFFQVRRSLTIAVFC